MSPISFNRYVFQNKNHHHRLIREQKIHVWPPISKIFDWNKTCTCVRDFLCLCVINITCVYLYVRCCLHQIENGQFGRVGFLLKTRCVVVTAAAATETERKLLRTHTRSFTEIRKETTTTRFRVLSSVYSNNINEKEGKRYYTHAGAHVSTSVPAILITTQRDKVSVCVLEDPWSSSIPPRANIVCAQL